MTSESLYITIHGKLVRKGNTLYFVDMEKNKKPLPVEVIRDIYVMARVSLSSGTIGLLTRKNIVVHFFNKYGTYLGTLQPRKQLLSGLVQIKQAEHYLNTEKRRLIAKKMVEAIKANLVSLLSDYKANNNKIGEIIDEMKKLEVKGDINNMRQIEGACWEIFYKALSKIINRFKFEKRIRRPPIGEVNALISYANSLLYTTVITEIHHTYLNPTFSFVHEPRERRYSLALDIADIFKPIISMRTVIALVNQKIIQKDDFTHEAGTLLTKIGRQKLAKYYKDRLNNTIYVKNLKRKVSYRYLIRLEAYKLVKHFIEDKEYEPFKAR